ncbi:hypothetical protein PENTCL1PPCAC_10632, partial [Pristionchus entomophagus]
QSQKNDHPRAMSTPSTVDGHAMDEHEDMEAEDNLDSSSSHVHDSSKDGDADDQSQVKPKRNRKCTQRFLDSFTDEDLSFAHKQKKKSKPAKKMDSSDAHNDSEDRHSEATSEHEPNEDSEKERRTRVVPGKAHVQCTFMESKKKTNSQCKQRAIEGFVFCIWHILNDKSAPYKRCAHMRDKEKTGMETVQVQCKTAIKDTQEPPFCLAHSDRVKKPKKKRDSGPSPSVSNTKGSSETASPQVGGSMAPSSPSSSLFNLPNDEFALDIDEAIGNMDAPGNLDSLMNTFDDFDSIDNLDDDEKEDVKPPPSRQPLPFDVDDELDEREMEMLNEIVSPLYTVGSKIIDRLKNMREQYKPGPDFWRACHSNPEAPSTTEEYVEKFMTEGRFEQMTISSVRKEEIRGLLLDPSSELSQELALLHKYNTDLLREQHTLQRSFINNFPR